MTLLINKPMEKGFKGILFISSFFSIVSVLLIAIFIFSRGIPAIAEIGFFNFIFGLTWNPSANAFGIFPMIVGSLCITFGALLLGLPLGILTAIYLARFCRPSIYRFLKPAVELLAGIPSVVYGFFGLVVIVPWIMHHLGGAGNSLLAASIVLGIMILPTIIAIGETSIRAVPESYYEGALALGSTHEEAVCKVVTPAARSGLLTAVILGIGRAIGETMAVILVAGNSPILPEGILSSIRSLTANIAMEMSYAQGLHQGALFGTGVVLFVFIILLITFLNFVTAKAGSKG